MQSVADIKNYNIRLEKLQSKVHLDDGYSSFLNTHPTLLEKTSLIQKIFNCADYHGLDLSGVDYKQEDNTEDPLVHLYISFGMTEPYPKTKAFFNELLNEFPFLTIDNLSYIRNDISSDAINTKIRLGLHFKK
jgi:hypothetical protein